MKQFEATLSETRNGPIRGSVPSSTRRHDHPGLLGWPAHSGSDQVPVVVAERTAR
jgi:hypothetical protein